MSAITRRPIFWVTCCIIFGYFSLEFAAMGRAMFGDTDPLWHVAAGDLIRQLHAIPEHDPWSFTAGSYRWLNISWAWDVIFSFMHEYMGWYAAVAVNGMIVASIITLIYASCLLRTGKFTASFFTTIGAMTLLSLQLRPLQISNLMVAVWMLVLGAIARGHLRLTWLLVLPVLAVVWVNMHGGFIVAPLLLGAFFLQALHERRYALARALFLTGMVTAAALLCNPYGVSIAEAAWRPLTTHANQFIKEWQPFTASPSNLVSFFYLSAFVPLVLRRPLPALPAERWLAYFSFILALAANRSLSIFAIISAPLVACSVQQLLERFSTLRFVRLMAQAMMQLYDRRLVAALAVAACVAMVIWLPTPMAARTYSQENIATDNLDTEIAFIRQHYPKARLLTHFDLGGIILYQTRGEIPVFVDARTETAYPAAIFNDYIRFLNADFGWEDVFDRYALDGVMLPISTNPELEKDYRLLRERFNQRKGWEAVFTGPRAVIFMRTH